MTIRDPFIRISCAVRTILPLLGALALASCTNPEVLGRNTENGSTSGDSGTDSTGTDGTATTEMSTTHEMSTTSTTATTTTEMSTTEMSTTEMSTTEMSTTTTTTGSTCENFLPPIEPEALSPGKVGVIYEVAFTVPGLDAENTAWTLEGDLPGGLAFDDASGILSGTPEAAGRVAFSLTAAPIDDIPECSTVPTSVDYNLVIDP